MILSPATSTKLRFAQSAGADGFELRFVSLSKYPFNVSNPLATTGFGRVRDPSTKKVRCGVIGAGWWATSAHIPALLADPRAELVALQKRDAQEAERVAKHFGVKHACTSVEELLSIEGLSAVVVSSSPHLHFEHARAALERGKHVLLEKPMTIRAREARELTALAEKMGVQLLISCPWHYTRHSKEARARILAGELGEIRMVSILMTNAVAHLIRGESTEVTHGVAYLRPNSATYSDEKISGGGHIYAQSSHLGAYLSFITGEPPVEVFARFHNDGGSLDIFDVINVKLRSGCIASIATTGLTSPRQRSHEVRVFGTKGILFLELWHGKMELLHFDGETEVFSVLLEDEIYPGHAPAQNLIDCVSNPSLNDSPGTLGAAAMELIEAACLSAQSGRNVPVESLEPCTVNGN